MPLCGRLIIGFTYTSVPQISLEGYAYAFHESGIASQSTMWMGALDRLTGGVPGGIGGLARPVI